MKSVLVIVLPVRLDLSSLVITFFLFCAVIFYAHMTDIRLKSDQRFCCQDESSILYSFGHTTSSTMHIFWIWNTWRRVSRKVCSSWHHICEEEKGYFAELGIYFLGLVQEGAAIMVSMAVAVAAIGTGVYLSGIVRFLASSNILALIYGKWGVKGMCTWRQIWKTSFWFFHH